jgi:hypothetical protein
LAVVTDAMERRRMAARTAWSAYFHNLEVAELLSDITGGFQPPPLQGGRA